MRWYSSFKDNGKNAPPKGYKYIKVFFVYAVKHDLCHRAQLVAGGHMTKDNGDSYSSVISLEGMSLAIMMGEINNLQTMAGDIVI